MGEKIMAQPDDWVQWDGPQPPRPYEEEDLNPQPIPMWDEQNPDPGNVSEWVPEGFVESAPNVAAEEWSPEGFSEASEASEASEDEWVPEGFTPVEELTPPGLGTVEGPDAAPISTMEAAGRGFRQGGSLGFADEMGAGFGAGLDVAFGDAKMADFGDNYRSLRDEYRDEETKAAAYHPVAYGAGNVAGMALPMALTGGTGGLVQGTAKMGAVGAGMGAGEAEEMSDIPKEALIGGALTAAGGAVGHGVGTLTTKALQGMNRGGSWLAGKGADKAANMVPDSALNTGVLDGIKLGEYGWKNFAKDAVVETAKDIGKLSSKRLSVGDLMMAGAGAGMTGGPWGALMGAAAGSVRTGVGKAVKKKIQHSGTHHLANMEEALLRNVDRLGKYAMHIKSAAARGGGAVASTDYMLQQRDEDYRKLRMKAMEGEK